MFHYYFQVNITQNKTIKMPADNEKDMEAKVPDCFFEPATVPDYPNYDEYPAKDWQQVEKKLGEKAGRILHRAVFGADRDEIQRLPELDPVPQLSQVRVRPDQGVLFPTLQRGAERGSGGVRFGRLVAARHHDRRPRQYLLLRLPEVRGEEHRNQLGLLLSRLITSVVAGDFHAQQEARMTKTVRGAWVPDGGDEQCAFKRSAVRRSTFDEV